jgi:hypothetical protein
LSRHARASGKPGQNAGPEGRIAGGGAWRGAVLPSAGLFQLPAVAGSPWTLGVSNDELPALDLRAPNQ